MLTGRILDWQAAVPGGTEGLADDLLNQRWRGNDVGDIPRPDSIPAGRWRRMSRFSRLTAVSMVPLRERHPGLDWRSLPMVQGSAMGEVIPSSDFLDRWFSEGPEHASPTNFQNSVYNATGAHLSLTFDLQGPAETLSAGMATGIACLARGLEWLDHHEHVLVVVGDDLNRTTAKALQHTGRGGDLSIAVLLARGEGVTVEDAMLDGVFSRGTAMPYERRFEARPGLRPEATIGLNCAGGLLAYLATGRAVVDADDGMTIGVR